MLRRTTHLVDNGDGWLLGLRQVVDDEQLDRRRRPVALIPGYGMNTHILGYHPTGRSMEAYLASCGLEVWAVSLRAMETSVRTGSGSDALAGGSGFKARGLVDLGAALEHIVEHSQSEQRRVDLVGCSLGGTLLFVHLALATAAQRDRLGALVALGAPLRWVEINRLLGALFSSPWLARNLRLKYSRQLCRPVLPLLRRFPSLLRIYLHPELVDLAGAEDELVKVVEDPDPRLNEEIAHWLARRDLVIDGVNITEAVREIDRPLLVMTGNDDGIVPEANARFVYDWVDAPAKDYHLVGDAQRKYAHADLYVSRYSEELVFAPIAGWLGGVSA